MVHFKLSWPLINGSLFKWNMTPISPCYKVCVPNGTLFPILCTAFDINGCALCREEGVIRDAHISILDQWDAVKRGARITSPCQEFNVVSGFSSPPHTDHLNKQTLTTLLGSGRNGGVGEEAKEENNLVEEKRAIWYPIFYIVPFFWQGPLGLWSKVVHYVGNRVSFGTKTESEREGKKSEMLPCDSAATVWVDDQTSTDARQVTRCKLDLEEKKTLAATHNNKHFWEA